MNPVHHGQLAATGEATPQLSYTQAIKRAVELTAPFRDLLADAQQLQDLRGALRVWYLAFQDSSDDYLPGYHLGDSSFLYNYLDDFLAHNLKLHLDLLLQRQKSASTNPAPTQLLEAGLEAVRQASADHYGAILSEKEAHIAELQKDKAQYQDLLAQAYDQLAALKSSTPQVQTPASHE